MTFLVLRALQLNRRLLRFLQKRGTNLVDAGRQPMPCVECSLLVHPLFVALDLNHPHLFAAYGALITAATLTRLYVYRGRAFIVYWIGSWLLVASSFLLLARGYGDVQLGSVMVGLPLRSNGAVNRRTELAVAGSRRSSGGVSLLS